MLTALDIGCGSGQSTVALSQHFKEVIGADVSEAQLAQTPQGLPGAVSFRVSSAEDLSFQASGSVDLVTVASAIHWIDLDQFYPEVERVLRPGGVLAVYGYSLTVLDSDEGTELTTQVGVLFIICLQVKIRVLHFFFCIAFFACLFQQHSLFFIAVSLSLSLSHASN